MSSKIKKFGKFKLLEQVARGGMAEIFLASAGSIENAHKFVVIKRILLGHSHNKEFKKMFQNEGKIAVNLNHSNICSIYEFGVVRDQYFICMEYISGRNIRQLVRKLKSQKKNLDVALCAYIIKHACNGLDYAHNCVDSVTGQPLNIIHRDISPQNIMVSFNGDVKVIDFGIAKIDDSEATKVGVLKGKFEYMSPEQARGKSLDRQTDIFSLGNVLWETLAGRKLFIGNSEIQLLKKIRDCQIPDLRKINPNVPQRLSEIVNKALSANKNLRYKTVAEMGNDISVFLNKTYPDFTHNTFSSFIREVYIEEINEERKKLKTYSSTLVSQKLRMKTGIQSQDLVDKDLVPSRSTFIGPNTKLDKEEGLDSASQLDDSELTIKTDEGSEISAGKHTVTQTEQKHTVTQTDIDSSIVEDQPRDITKTEFSDELDRKTMSTVWTKYDKNQNEGTFKSNVSSTHRSIITNDGLDSRSISTGGGHSDIYDPYLKIKQPVKSSSVSRKTAGKRKKLRRRAVIRKIAVGFAVFGIAGAGYTFRFDIKAYVSNIAQKLEQVIAKHITSTHPISDHLQKEEASSPTRTAKKPSEEGRNPTSLNAGLKKVVEKEVFINTQPSGAWVFIDNKRRGRPTPTSIVVSVNNPVRLTLKKEGYRDKKVVLSSRSIREGKAKFSLTKHRYKKKKNETIIIY